ncbi:MAG: T9SS type A sorting domain-containing protein, partial [Bacteroidales bacterium]|nr:T9SS type A sorting domain-containing protein [Bacteroidales bacterium]
KYNKVTNENLHSLCLIDRNTGWAVGSNGTILYFNGTSWENFESPTNKKLYSVSFRNPEQGIAVGERGTILLYEKGKWTLAKRTTMAHLFSVNAGNDLTLIGGGLECLSVPIMKMDEITGKKPVTVFSPENVEIKCVFVINKNRVWAVGRPGAIFYFDGMSWNIPLIEEKMPSLNSIAFNDQNKGLAVGYGGAIFTYSDDVWEKVESPVQNKLNGAVVYGNAYYAVGNNGTLVAMNWKPQSPPDGESNRNPDTKLETYPNPASGFINVRIPAEWTFNRGQVTITNISGQVIMMKTLDDMSVGQIIPISISGFSNGLYLVKIQADGKTATGRFIIKR